MLRSSGSIWIWRLGAPFWLLLLAMQVVAAVVVAATVLRWWLAATARGWCVSGRGGSWDPAVRVRSTSAGMVERGRRSVAIDGGTTLGEILVPIFIRAGDGGARGCRYLS